MISSISQRILTIVNQCEGQNKSRFGRKIGAQSGLVGNWISGRSEPGAKYRKAIRDAYGISENWLDTGVGEMYVNKELKPPPNISPHYQQEPRAEVTMTRKEFDLTIENSALKAKYEETKGQFNAFFGIIKETLEGATIAIRDCTESKKEEISRRCEESQLKRDTSSARSDKPMRQQQNHMALSSVEQSSAIQ